MLFFRIRHQLRPLSQGQQSLIATPRSDQQESSLTRSNSGCGSCNRARDIASDANALANLDAIAEQTGSNPTQNSRPNSSSSNVRTETVQAREVLQSGNSPDSHSNLSNETKSQFVSQGALPPSLLSTQGEGALRSAVFASNTPNTLNLATSQSQASQAARNAKSPANTSGDFRAVQAQGVQNARAENLVNRNGLPNTAAILVKNSNPAVSVSNPASLPAGSQVSHSSLLQPRPTNVGAERAVPLPLQANTLFAASSQHVNTITALPPGASLIPVLSTSQTSIPQNSVLAGLRQVFVPIFQALGLEGLRNSALRFTHSLSSPKTVLLPALGAVSQTPLRNLNVSLQFFARAEKNILQFFNLLQGAYLNVPEEGGANLESLSQDLALLRQLQEKMNKTEKKKKIQQRDYFVRVTHKGDHLTPQ